VTDRPQPALARATRVALIGLGEAGATIHLPALLGIADVDVVGAVDPDETRRRDASTRLGIPVFADLGELLATPKPDLVIIASPPALHAAHCIAAMNAGADVLCEKPFAASVHEGRDVLACAAAAGRRIAVNHEFRAMPVFRDVIAAVRADAWGPSVVQVWQAIDHNPAGERGWRGQLRRRGLYEAGVHLVDLAVQLFGEMPHAVSATFAAGDDGESAADAIVLAALEFSRGRLAQLVQCRVHRGDRQYLEVRADTRDASFRASFGGRARLTAGFLRSGRPHVALERGASGIAWLERGADRRVLSRNGGMPLVTATRDVIRACVATLRTDAPLPFPATDGVDALRIVAAAYRAAELGRTVALDGPDREATESMPLAGTAEVSTP
jgi:predicted dehydrogenase